MARKPNSSAQTRKLLVVMSLKPRTWQYGYQLSKETGLTSGTIYPTLIRLSDQGVLESQWQGLACPGKRPRHAYRLTSHGLALVRTMALTGKRSAVRQTH
jgi:PadR family transcriptional regulator, regulatory protein PadR